MRKNTRKIVKIPVIYNLQVFLYYYLKVKIILLKYKKEIRKWAII